MTVDSQVAASPSRPVAARVGTPRALLALLALWLVATLGWRPLLLPDEGRYAEVARAMASGAAGGDWLAPKLDGLPFFHKPPLFYWLDGLAMRLVGANAFSARIGSAIGAWLLGAALLLWMQRRHGPAAARVGLVVLATSPFYFVAAQYANHDMLVAGMITAAILAIARAVERPERVELGWLVAGWLACALGMLSKGLIGIVLPALVIGPWLLAQRRWRQVLGLLHPLGLAVFTVVALPWFVAMQGRYPGFFDYFFVEQHFRRFAADDFNNVHGAWFFVVLLPLCTLPWSAWLPAALARVWRARGAPAAGSVDPTLALYGWWVVAVVGFFSLPASKLIGYVLPALAPWCALLGLAVARQPARRIGWVAGASGALLVAVVAVFHWQTPGSSRALGEALGARIAADDRVIVIGNYPYDLPFYARLAQPLAIAGDWASPEIARHDNWKKEIHDAARFDPELAARLLRPLPELVAGGCPAPATAGADAGRGSRALWFVVPLDQREAFGASVPGAERIDGDRRRELWRRPC